MFGAIGNQGCPQCVDPYTDYVILPAVLLVPTGVALLVCGIAAARRPGLPVTSLILGVAGTTLWALPIVGPAAIALDAAAIALGVFFLRRVGDRGFAISGMVLGTVGLCAWVVKLAISGSFA